MEITSRFQLLDSHEREQAKTAGANSLEQSLNKIYTKRLSNILNEIVIYTNESLIMENMNQIISNALDRANRSSLRYSTGRPMRVSEFSNLIYGNENRNMDQQIARTSTQKPDVKYSVRVPPDLRQLKGMKVLLTIKNGKRKFGMQNQAKLRKLKLQLFNRIFDSKVMLNLSKSFQQIRFSRRNSSLKPQKVVLQTKSCCILNQIFKRKLRLSINLGFNLIHQQYQQMIRYDGEKQKEKILEWCVNKIALSTLNLRTSLWRMRYNFDGLKQNQI